jgi:sRNA-binding regulator protein Hfq
MLGHLNGVQAQIQREYPFAHFVHCVAHRLNLVLCQAASSIAPVKIFFVNGMTRVERFKTFVTSLRTDAKYSEFYDKAVEKVAPPVTRYDQRHNYKQMFF